VNEGIVSIRDFQTTGVVGLIGPAIEVR